VIPSARLDIRVIPRASRTKIDGIRAGRLMLRVTAPPVDDAANDAVVSALAKALSVPRSAIQITAGVHSRDKSIVISGVTPDDLKTRLASYTDARP
jgi:uncharacterized protein YggU (UPF0235/DUF167 family)